MRRTKLLLVCLLSVLFFAGTQSALAAPGAAASSPSGELTAELLKKGKKGKKKAKKGKRGKKGKANPLAGRYFWRFSEFRVDRSSDPVGLYFASPKLAYFGSPKRGLPRCRKANPKREGGKLVSGCVPYKLNKRGKLKVEKLKGTFRKGKLKLDGVTYYDTTIPKPRSTFAVKLIARGYSGFCGLITGCRTWKEDIVLTKKGEFVRSQSSITTAGGVGGGPFIWAGNFPPDETGKYKILSRGRLRLAYQNGTTDVHTMAINNNKRGKADLVKEGMILDDVWFYQGDE